MIDARTLATLVAVSLMPLAVAAEKPADAGKGAAIGAGVGATAGLLRRHDRRQDDAAAQQQAAAQYNQGMADFNRAFATCMQGRGYAVN